MVSLAHILLLSGCTIVINGQYEGRPRLPNKCAAVFCGATDCLNPTTPPGECCAVCPPTLPPHCAAVSCLRSDCLNPTTPPGGCCPVCPGKTCFYKGVRREDGETFKDDCNTCTCNNGNVRCTKRGCRKCDGIECPQLRCANQYTPPGQCCPVCRPIGKPDCSRVHCLHRYCVGQYTPPGECCPVCPRNTY